MFVSTNCPHCDNFEICQIEGVFVEKNEEKCSQLYLFCKECKRSFNKIDNAEAFCPHCRKFRTCQIEGVLVDTNKKEVEYFHLLCENCGSLFKEPA